MKENNAYKTISEATNEINKQANNGTKINTHTIRFWEKEFKQLKPKILTGNRRYYSKKDITLLKLIYELLKKQGFTIKGAKNYLNNNSNKLDVNIASDIKGKNLKFSLKKRAEKIKTILNKIKKLS
tara:strand:- start:8063 stop:8440 length:378 start_codon:yes stop_codon:yes gene_type:complete